MSKVNVFSYNVVVHTSELISDEVSKDIAQNILNGISNEINNGNGLLPDSVEAYTRKVVIKTDNNQSVQWNIKDILE